MRNLEFDLKTSPPTSTGYTGERETIPLEKKSAPTSGTLAAELESFAAYGTATRILQTTVTAGDGSSIATPVYVNEFWTARQRQANSLHEISYRACFKPQLPRFFIERLTKPGDVVYDPFMGRGTTPVEAALLGRTPWGSDINPLSQVMAGGRLNPPRLQMIGERLESIPLDQPADEPSELLAFYHPETLRGLSSLKNYFQARRTSGELDGIDLWLEMVCLNRLTGHSPGFFSVRTMPPNQAVSVKSQLKINARLKQTPPVRDLRKIILKKSRQLLADVTPQLAATLAEAAASSRLLTAPAHATTALPENSVQLVVTSPPFLDIVNYAGDNWLRCWFLGIDPEAVQLTVPRKLTDWAAAMTRVFRELHRLLKRNGHVAFEVGEVRGGAVKLEETVIPCGSAAGLVPQLVLINDQQFTKTANCWGVDNNSRGTNTNRIVLFRKP
ncbi:MAG TPA: DNA modification methylase [Verrucomicrobiales bacterium]|nr:DNA modification methylase [Verrucomicrobiales bacterium]